MLRTAGMGQVFATAFLVNALFHSVMALLGAVAAVATPTMFNANGVPTQSAGAALGVLLVMLIVATLINAASSAIGAALWIGLRRFIFRRAPAEAF